MAKTPNAGSASEHLALLVQSGHEGVEDSLAVEERVERALLAVGDVEQPATQRLLDDYARLVRPEGSNLSCTRKVVCLDPRSEALKQLCEPAPLLQWTMSSARPKTPCMSRR